MRQSRRCFLLIFTLAAAASLMLIGCAVEQPASSTFDGQRALGLVETQVKFGPRIPGSQAHQQTVEWIQKELRNSGWNVSLQEGSVLNHPVRNIIAQRGAGSPWLVLGAHFDTRMFADQDPDATKRKQPVPGANDGASGVAVLLELARVLPKNLKGQVSLMFFDAEDQGDFAGWDWILGSRLAADRLGAKPDAVVVIDMIGDADLNIYQERNSNANLNQSIWSVAAGLGYQNQLISKPKYAMEDDHTPFLARGIAAADLIDFDYPYWHTTQDTLDKVSAKSLSAVGLTLLEWIESR